MQISSSSLIALLTVTFGLANVNASPLGTQYVAVEPIARSMLGQTALSWKSTPLERSPFDLDASLTLQKRIVHNPPITYPTKGTVWTAGQSVYVDWTVGEDTPKSADASVMLGYLPKGDYNEHLKWTLASDFSLQDGSVSFKLPSDLETRQDYIVVLFGDSGNRSKRFTINALPNKTQTTSNDDQEQGADSKNSDSDVVVKANTSMLGRDLA